MAILKMKYRSWTAKYGDVAENDTNVIYRGRSELQQHFFKELDIVHTEMINWIRLTAGVCYQSEMVLQK